jgi:hypothetical protein
MKMFNKASKFLSDYFKHDESIEKDNSSNIEDNLIYLNSQIVLWKEDLNFDDKDFNSMFSFKYYYRLKLEI